MPASAADHPDHSARRAGGEPLPELDMPMPEHENRWTVFFRLLLLIPQFIAVFFLTIAAVLTVFVGWFAALVLGRLPNPIRRFLTGFLGYDTRVEASLMLLTDRYPPFRLHPRADYPVQIEVPPVHLNRLAVFFRILLMIPAMIVQSLLTAGWWSVSFVMWLIVLVMGRMPEPLFQASSAILRYRMRVGAYTLMLASAYPKRLFGDEAVMSAEAAERPATQGTWRSATRPLTVGTAGKVLIGVFLLLGIAGAVGNGIGWSVGDDDDGRYSAPRTP
jgi:hypothetical protein